MQSCLSPLGKKVDGKTSKSYFYQPFTRNIIYSPDGNWFEVAYEKLDADKESFKALSNSVGKDNQVVFYKYFKQPQVDLQTFTVVNNVMKDKNSVYKVDDNHKLVPVLGADPNSFSYLDPNSTNTLVWAKDKSSYFMNDLKVKVDYATFRIVNENLFYDKDSIYIELDQGILGRDATTERLDSINKFYAKGANSIYYYGYKNFNIGYEKVSISEIRTTEIIDEATLKVNDNTILFEGSIFPVATVDAKSFMLLNINTSYYKDKNNIYYRDKVLEGADVNSFQLIGENSNDKHPSYAKDKNHVYWMGKIVKDANVNKFHYDKKKHQWTDGTYSFHGNDSQ